MSLFAEEKVSLVKSAEESDEYLYLKFHRNMRKRDVMRQVRKIVKKDRFKSQSKYSIKNVYKYFYLHQQYNTLVMRTNGGECDEDCRLYRINLWQTFR